MPSAPSFPDGTDFRAAMSPLSFEDILDVIEPDRENLCNLTSTFDTNREELLEELSELSLETLLELKAAAELKSVSLQERDRVDNDYGFAGHRIDSDRAQTRRDKFVKNLTKEYTTDRVCMVCARPYKVIYGSAQAAPTDLYANGNALTPNVHKHGMVILGGMLLHTPSVSYANEYANGPCCVECLESINVNRKPPFALANDLWVGPVPPQLKDLSLVEQLLIARVSRTMYKMDILTAHTEQGNAKFTNKTSMTPLKRSSVRDGVLDRRMPQMLEYVRECLTVSITGPKVFAMAHRPPILLVRRAKVEAALVWLKAHNDLYRGIVIVEARLGQLPANDIPLDIRKDIKLYANTRDHILNTRKRPRDTRTLAEIDANSYLDGVEYFKCDPSSLEALRLPLEHPHLLCYGTGGTSNRQSINPDFQKRGAWCLDYEDGRFRNSKFFLTHLLWDIQEVQTRQAFHRLTAEGLLRLPPFGAILGEEEIVGAMSSKSWSTPYIDKLEEARAAINFGVVGCPTPPTQACDIVRGMSMDNNPPNLLMSISPTKGSDVLSLLFGRHEFGGHELGLSTASSVSYHRKFLESNPHTTVQRLDHVTDCIINDFLGVSRNDSFNSNELGFFGVVKGYVGFVTPAAGIDGHQSPMIHLFLWLNGNFSRAKSADLLKDDHFRDALIEYIQCNIHCDVDDLGLHHSEEMVLNAQDSKWSAKSRRAWVDDDGGWGPKMRSTKYLPWTPHILPIVNHTELFTNSEATRFEFLNRAAVADKSLVPKDRQGDLETLMIMQAEISQFSFEDLVIEFTCASHRTLERPDWDTVRCINGDSPILKSHRFVEVYIDSVFNKLALTHASWERRHSHWIYDKRGQVQMENYMARGNEFLHMCYMDFLLETEKFTVDGSDTISFTVPRPSDDIAPCFVGSKFPDGGGVDDEFFSAAVLACFKPWVAIEDLVGEFDGYVDAFQQFTKYDSGVVADRLANMVL